MADNMTMPALGDVVGSDDVGGVHYQRVKIMGGVDGVVAPIKTDTLTNAIATIAYPHAEIHGGVSFHACIANVGGAMADAATMVLAFKTAAGTKRAHMEVTFATLVGGHIEILEGPTWDAESGTSVDIFNRKRLDAMTSSTLLADEAQAGFVAADVLHADPTTLAGGTSIVLDYAFGLAGKVGAGGGGDRKEFVLNVDTQYAVKFTADGAANKAFMCLDWYEHEDA